MEEIQDLTNVKYITTIVSATSKITTWKYLSKMGEYFHDSCCFDDAIECFKKSTQLIRLNDATSEIYKSTNKVDERLKIQVAINFRKIGNSLIELYKFEEAKTNLNESLKIL